MSSNANSEEFYTKLKSQLEELTVFPTVYLYKFIVPTEENDNKVKAVSDQFDNLGATIKTKKSKKSRSNGHRLAAGGVRPRPDLGRTSSTVLPVPRAACSPPPGLFVRVHWQL